MICNVSIQLQIVHAICLFVSVFGSECVCTETASEQPTGHSGLTEKAEEEGFKVFVVLSDTIMQYT